jgi:hypothetical protein
MKAEQVIRVCVLVALGALMICGSLLGTAAAATFQPGVVMRQEDPALTTVLEQLALSYQRGLSETARRAELHWKARDALRLAGVERLSDLRERAMVLLFRNGKGIEWESLRTLTDENGKSAGVWLTVPVWLPRGVQSIATHGAPVERWQDVQGSHRFAGEVYLPPALSAINDKKSYQAGTLTFETLRGYAPFAYLLCEAIFREGWLDAQRRVPILSIRSGEDCFAADPRQRPGTIPCFSFQNPNGKDFLKRNVDFAYKSLAEVYHGHHAMGSNHRLGCALDINDINCDKCQDGSPNPVSRAGRHFLRERMHALDARNLPFWVYQMAEEMGQRVPYQWNYGNGFTDWQHVDCGVLDKKQWERLEQQMAATKP